MRLYITDDDLKLQIKRRVKINVIIAIIAILIICIIASVFNLEGDKLILPNVDSLQSLNDVQNSEAKFFKITANKIVVTDKTVGMIEEGKEAYGSYSFIELDKTNVVLLLSSSQVNQVKVKNNVNDFTFIANISSNNDKSNEIINELIKENNWSDSNTFDSVLECTKYTVSDTIFSLAVLSIAFLVFLALGVWNNTKLFELLRDKKRRKNEQ